jgi:hypothetical protein
MDVRSFLQKGAEQVGQRLGVTYAVSFELFHV